MWVPPYNHEELLKTWEKRTLIKEAEAQKFWQQQCIWFGSGPRNLVGKHEITLKISGSESHTKQIPVNFQHMSKPSYKEPAESVYMPAQSQ